MITSMTRRNRTQEFRTFLNLINREVPDYLDVHVVLDNASPHNTEPMFPRRARLLESLIVSVSARLAVVVLVLASAVGAVPVVAQGEGSAPYPDTPVDGCFAEPVRVLADDGSVDRSGPRWCGAAGGGFYEIRGCGLLACSCCFC